MGQRHQDLLYLCQEGNIKKVEKYLTKFGMDFLNIYSVSHLLVMSVCTPPEHSYSKKALPFNKNQFLVKLKNMEKLISLGLNPLDDFQNNKGHKDIRLILSMALKEPTYLLIIEKFRELGVLPDKALYASLEDVLINVYGTNSVKPEFLVELNRLDIKINSNNGKIVKSIILANQDQLALNIFNLGYANAWFYAREIKECTSEKLKIYFESIKVGDSIDIARPPESLEKPLIKKNKI